MRTYRSRRLRRSRRPLRLWLRTPVAHWTLAGGLALVTVTSLQARSADLDRREALLGPTVSVVVAVGDHDAGERIDRGDTAVVDVPEAMAPAGALTEPPDGERLAVPLSDREVVTEQRFAAGRLSELAATIPPGRRAVAVPLPVAALRLAQDDHVELLAISPNGSSDVVVADGIVLATDDGSVTIAVPADDVGAVADAILAATLTVALAGPE